MLSNQVMSQIVLNEICTFNDDVIEDIDEDKSDWIELYNSGNFVQNLSDYSLYSHKQNTNFNLPNVFLNPNEFKIIFISGKNKFIPEVHSNFKMIVNDTISLLQNQTPVSQILAYNLFVDHSYGAVGDGTIDFGIFTDPTPGTTNNYTSHFNEYSMPPIYSLEGGFYNSTQTLTLNNATPGTLIYYTLDGSMPYFNSPIYTNPIVLNKNTVVKAYSVSPGKPASKTICKGYFINENIQLPVVSISTDSVLLFDSISGLLSLGPLAETIPPYYGANFWSDTQIKVHVEIFDKQKKEIINQQCELQIHGGSTNRSQPMKSFRLLSKKKFEKDRFYVNLIKDKPIEAYRKLVLRNGSSDFLKSHLREGLIHKTLIKNTHIDAIGYEPCVVFINGKYYGLMEIREKIDEYYVEQNYGIDKDNVDVLSDTNLVDIGNWYDFDSIYRFVLHNDLKVPANFDSINNKIDLNNMTDYFIAQTYFNNNDWPASNLRLWHQRIPFGKFKYIAFDLDASLGTFDWSPYTLNMLHESLNYFTKTVPIKHCIILKKLLENDAYKQYFINRYADLFNTAFSSNYLISMLDTLANNIRNDVPRHYNKWGKQYYDWENEINIKIIPYIKNRHQLSKEDVLNEFNLPAYHHLKISTYPIEAFKELHINTVKITENNFEGFYFESVPISFKVSPHEGYIFSHWQHSNGSQFFKDSLQIDLKESTEITAIYFKESEKNGIIVYPNPTLKNKLYIRLANDVKQLRNLSILNTLGEEIYNSNDPKINGAFTVELDVSNFKNGIYFIRINLLEKTETIKFVVND
jgi:hypothetical protein